MRKPAILGLVAAFALAGGAARADISDGAVKIAVLNDMSGIYAASSGPGTVEAVRMAVEDFGGTVLGKPIEVLFADHQNKPDVGVTITNRWIDVDKVDVIVDVPNSAIAIAVQDIAREKNRVFIGGGAGTAQLTGDKCSPTGVHYIYDTYSLAATAGKAAVERLGKSFFFLTVDYTFGPQLEGAVTHFVTQAGGKVSGGVKHPLATPDFSSFILQAQSSGAEVIALANAAGDTANAIKAANEFGVIKAGQHILALLALAPDIKAIGLEQAQGIYLASPFFWNRTPEAAEWSRRYYQRTRAMPSMAQAGAYSYAMHYLRAVQEAGTDEARAVVRKMKELPIDDFFAKGYIRKDGRMVHDMYLVQVKSPQESTEDWDLFKLIETIPGEQAFRPLEAGNCPLLDQM